MLVIKFVHTVILVCYVLNSLLRKYVFPFTDHGVNLRWNFLYTKGSYLKRLIPLFICSTSYVVQL